jgi:hypothetical protein
MTVTSSTSKSRATGNGVTTAFTGSFRILDESHVKVTHTSTVGVDTVKTITTDYTVSGVGGSSFTVTHLVAPASGVVVTLSRNVPATQELDLVENDDMPADELEKSFDKDVMLIQQIKEAQDRSIRFPVSDSTSLSAELPVAALRANKVVAFDADGDVAVSTLDLDDIEDGATDAATSAAAAAVSAAAALVSENNADASETAAAASALAAAAAAASGLFAYIEDQSTNFVITADTDNTTLYKVDTAGGNVTATLPSIATAGEGERYGFTRVSASNTLTLVPDGTDTINGVAANYTVPAVVGEILLIVADDATPDNWIVIRWALTQADGTSLSQSGNTLSINVGNTNTFTAPQRHTPLADNDGSFDLNARQDFTCTPTGAVALTFTNKPTGQKGTILFVNGSNYAITRAANVLADADFNALVSATGTYVISYWSYDGTNVALVATKALT